MMGLLGLILAGFACADSRFDDDGEGGFRLTPEAESKIGVTSEAGKAAYNSSMRGG